MIKRFQIQNYKALRDVTLDLTRMHVLIGPNDSGKTSILEAIATLCRSVDYPLAQVFTGAWEGCDLVWKNKPDLPIFLSVTVKEDQLQFDYRISCKFLPKERNVYIHEERFERAEGPQVNLGTNNTISNVYRTAVLGNSAPDDIREVTRLVHDSLSGTHFYRWNPRLLALPVAPDSKRRFRMDSSGFGLALCLDDILGYDWERFADLMGRFRQIFKHIKTIRLLPEAAYRSPTDNQMEISTLEKADGKGIYFELADGQQVRASQASDGVLLVLAYLTVLYLPPPHQPRVVLVEEPENGIHPKRLQDVLKILRDLVQEQTQSQVILTTHSPYALDHFEPEEVSLCHKGEDGAVSIFRLSESQKVRELASIFTLGVIWTAEGDEALIQRDNSGWVSKEGAVPSRIRALCPTSQRPLIEADWGNT